MTPGARISAAISIIDVIFAGQAAEQTLTHWARRNRYAGSSDRAAIRDMVFEVLRCRKSFAALGGAETGRGVMIGSLRARGVEPDSLFSGEGYAPLPLTPLETGREPTYEEKLDLPQWLINRFEQSLGDDAERVALALRERAPVFLRVNTIKTNVAEAVALLQKEEITAIPHSLALNALCVTKGAKRIKNSQCYQKGYVELQDVSSQAVVEALLLKPGMKVLDLCAGGGGKTLAIAAYVQEPIYAYDAIARRMSDLPARAKRAGANVVITQNPQEHGPYDLVFVDAPCSGSGAWRRDPEGKWRLSQEMLANIINEQSQILHHASHLLRPSSYENKGGVIAYVTCSLLKEENDDQVETFLNNHSQFMCQKTMQLTPLLGGDGFFLACLSRINAQIS